MFIASEEMFTVILFGENGFVVSREIFTAPGFEFYRKWFRSNWSILTVTQLTFRRKVLYGRMSTIINHKF